VLALILIALGTAGAIDLYRLAVRHPALSVTRVLRSGVSLAALCILALAISGAVFPDDLDRLSTAERERVAGVVTKRFGCRGEWFFARVEDLRVSATRVSWRCAWSPIGPSVGATASCVDGAWVIEGSTNLQLGGSCLAS